MELVFTGTFQRSLDGKQRLLLPSQIRIEVGNDSATMFLTPGTDRCLELHTPNSLGQLANKAKTSSSGTQNLRSFSRLFYAQAERCKVDSQGRIRVPARLVEWAEIEKEVVLIGVGFNWEIWNQDSWAEFVKNHQSNYDQIHQTTFDEQALNIDNQIQLPPLPKHAK